MKLFYRGDEITKIEVMKKLRTPIINLLNAYPLYYSYGIIEYYFEKDFKDKVVNMLDKDGFIEIKPNTLPRQYRLTSKGVDLATSMINLRHTKEVKKYTKEMRDLTIALFILGALTFLISLNQFFSTFLQ